MNFFLEIILSALIGLSIFLSYPIVTSKKISRKYQTFLTAIAVGILIFLVSDIFSDVSLILFSGNSLYGYGTNTVFDIEFIASLFAGFFMLYIFEFRPGVELKSFHISLMISIGIGLQNLTEGLVFGSNAATIGFSGVTLVVFTGFVVQNIAEGFPIGAPMFGEKKILRNYLPVFFLIGGIPTILGGGIGYYLTSVTFELIFDGLAIGSILYIIVSMSPALFRNINREIKKHLYLGVFFGFVLGLVVNLF